jgi:hypothetical protein
MYRIPRKGIFWLTPCWFNILILQISTVKWDVSYLGALCRDKCVLHNWEYCKDKKRIKCVLVHGQRSLQWLAAQLNVRHIISHHATVHQKWPQIVQRWCGHTIQPHPELLQGNLLFTLCISERWMYINCLVYRATSYQRGIRYNSWIIKWVNF